MQDDEDGATRPAEDSPSVVGQVFQGHAGTLPLRTVAADAFELRAELARGGMGRIVEAWDVRHQRRVAIKLLLRRGAASERRFLREIMLTLRLQHPAIIPVYEAGVLPSGEWFYSMRLVPGHPLSEVVAGTRSPSERLALLPNLVALCDALAYAHGEGVIHRDLKPANVLLGAFGETVVIDWGLAKEIGERGGDGDGARAEDPLATGFGTALGTPAYMPPEQARGEAVDARADVYALGALVYHVLAGAPPYSGAGAEEIVRRVLSGPPEALRRVAPDVPADLAAIVEKAMARKPAARYATAREMAEDLRAFATGRLVSAYRYRLPARIRRFVARNRAAVAVGAVLGVALVGIAGASVVRIVDERNDAVAARVLATEARGQANLHRDGAEQLVAFMLSKLRDKLQSLGRLDLLEGVADEVDGYLRGLGPADLDPRATRRRVDALELLAQVRDDQERYPAELELLDRARSLTDSLERGDDRSALRGKLLRRTGATLLSQGKYDEARAALEKALAELPTGAGDERARVLELVATIHRRRGDLFGTVVLLDAARVLALRDPASAHQAELDTTAGLVLRDAGHLALAIARFERAIGHFEGLRRRRPDDNGIREHLARARFGMGKAEQSAGHRDAALAWLRSAVTEMEDLCLLEPANRDWQAGLATMTGGLAGFQMVYGDLEEAERTRRKAIAIIDRVLAGAPGNDVARMTAASFRHDLAVVQTDRGDLDGARATLESLLPMAREGARRQPDRKKWRVLVVATLGKRCYVALQGKRWEEAAAACAEGIPNARALLLESPRDPTARRLLWEVLLSMGRVHLAQRRPDEAVSVLQETLTLAEAAVVESAELSSHAMLWNSLDALADALEPRDRAAAVAARRRALAVLEPQAAKGALSGDAKVLLKSLRAKLRR